MKHRPLPQPDKATLSTQDLEDCLAISAGLVADHGEVFLDLYLRFEQAVRATQDRTDLLKRIVASR